MKVVVIGGGYAGLTVVRRLEDRLPESVDLVLIDESADHLIRHELHRVIRRPGFADDITIPYRTLLDRARVRRARVESVDPDEGTITHEGGVDSYEYAAVCLGSETNYYDLPSVDEHATHLERLDDALRIREDFLTVGADGRVVIGGAGLTGIQVAGELAALADEEELDPEITLVERLDAVAPGFPPNFQAAVREELEARDVTIRTRTPVTGATADRVELEDGSIAYDQFIWAGGIRGPTALSGTRPEVRGTLRLGDGTFVVGDAATVIDRDGERVPASAQSAIREARTAATNIERLVEYDLGGGDVFEPRLDEFDFRSRGWIVSIGDGTVAQFGPTVLRGTPALALKATAGVGYLTSVGAIREAVDIAREEFSGAGLVDPPS